MTPRRALSLAAPLFLITGCDTADPTTIAAVPAISSADVRIGADWSAPFNVGPPINVPGVTDGNPALSKDGLALYYDSDRTDLPGALGARDIWVARRVCTDHTDPACAWQTPRNLGPLINTPHVDGTPELSPDGHYLFFISHTTRDDCPLDPDAPDPSRPCDEDIFVSWRADTHDDLAWSAPVRLPAPLNTQDGENSPEFVHAVEPGSGNLYFSRAVGNTTAGTDIYSAAIRLLPGPDGLRVRVIGEPVPVAELNAPNVLDGGITITPDGRELFFHSAAGRPGMGAIDIWTSTRNSPADPWSDPVNVTSLNSSMADLAPRLSHDGRTIVFTSNREGPRGAAGWEIWMATRASEK